MSIEFYWVAVAVVTVTSAARLTRLATWDKFPPAEYLRNAYADWTERKPRRLKWQLLAFCGYCASFWITALVVLWAHLAGVLNGYHDTLSEDIWLYANGVLGGSYLAAVLMAHDGDDGEDEVGDDGASSNGTGGDDD